MKLKDRVTIVTGGGRGIGRAIAERFAQEGAAVMLASLSESELQETAKAIAQAGGRVAYQVADVSREADVMHLVAATQEQLGPIDILVNNAGIYGPVRELQTIKPAEWDQVMAVNLRSAYLMMRAVLPEMLARQRGIILNISTVSAKLAYPYAAAYAASKAGMLALTRVVASEVARAGIRVNALCPGPVAGTCMWDELGPILSKKMGITREQLESLVLGGILQGRRPTPEEIAAAAIFLCSDDASAVTGQAFNVDGGSAFY